MPIEAGPYPFTAGAFLHGVDLDGALEMSPGTLPPQNNLGVGAGFGKLWLDTSTTPYTLRICVVPRAGLTYFAEQWTIIATLSATGFWIPSAPSFLEVSPNSGDTLNAPVGIGAYVIIPAVELAALTVVLPHASPGQPPFEISSTKTIDALTVDAFAGQFMATGPFIGVLGADGGVSFRFNDASTWYRRY